jgi:hypothetical protein
LVKQKYFGVIAEEIVLQILKNKGHKVIDNRKDPKKFGDFQVGDKIMEVKGQSEDHTGGKSDDFDFVARYITLSVKEWKFVKKSPNLFEVYVVYRLNEKQYKDHPDWNKVKYVCIKGSELKNQVAKPSSYQVKTLKPFWKNMGERQKTVSKTIWTKVKKGYEK